MNRFSRPMARAGALIFGLLFALVAGASAQTTNLWTSGGNVFWSFTNNWSPATNYPDSVGAVAIVTNNLSDFQIYLTNSITLGELVMGDADRGSYRSLRSTNATVSTITFNTGDGSMALFEHATGERPNRDVGRSDDYTDVGVVVADPDGLFIDNWQNFGFYGNGTSWNPDPARAFDGGGHDVVKGEDGSVFFRRVVTNIANFTVRDGYVEFQPEGNPVYKPGISNLVLGVAPGTVDTGASPRGVTTNSFEGSAYDRIQFPYFSIVGANTTNGAAAMTNDMQVTFNRGVFRSLDRPMTNGAPAVYTGTFTLNGTANDNLFIIEHQNFGTGTSAVRQTVFAGQLVGDGGFTKFGTGEMTLITNNTFTGAMNINRSFDNGRGRYGGVGLRENGTVSGVSQITLNRDGQLFLDNSVVNLSNRVNDAAAITTRGRNQIEMYGNASAASYELFGSVTTAQGSLAFEFDKVDGSPQLQTLELSNLVRTVGSVVGFHASDLRQGAFGLNGPTGIVVNLLDGGASLTQLGAGGGVGASNRSIVVGVFGGDGVDNGSGGVLDQVPNRADEFMTMEGNRLRTLDANTEMVSLGGRVTNALYITQASASQDANVNISFMSRPLTLNVYSLTNQINPVADKIVRGDSIFNSIRFGIARGNPIITGTLTNNPDDNGRSLLIDDGIKLTSESGMLLFGRDTGSASGDDSPNGNVLIYGGTIDLDGSANNREAIIHNASGNSAFLRGSVQASQGLTKSGTDSIYLDTANSLGGTVSIAQGTLVARHSRALDGATLVHVEGDGLLELQSGIALTNVNLLAGERPYGSAVLQASANHNVFGGDIAIENVDPQGLLMHDVRVRAGVNGQTASLTILGDIGLTETTMTTDVNLLDAMNFAFLESGGILNLKGTFGDRLVAGEALPFDPTLGGALPYTRVTSGFMTNRAANDNFVLRFNMDENGGANSGDEAVLNIYRAWNAAGRFFAQQGTIRFLGDDGFWTTNALAASDFSNGNSGFQLGGGGTDQGGSVTLLLTKDGQSFNAERWTAAQDQNANNTITIGLEHTGPSNATATIGNEWYDIDPSAADDQITISGASATAVRELRLFAHDGYDSATTNATTGRVNVIQSIRGNDYSILTTVGNGTIALQATTNLAIDQSNDIRMFNLLGGELILDRQAAGTDGALRRTTDNRAALALSGGDLTYLGRNNGNGDELLTSNLTVRAGDSQVAVKAGSGPSTNTLFLATATNTFVTRLRGGTVNLIEDQGGSSVANIRLGVTNFGQRVGSWATYGTNLYGGAYTWAATDASSNVIEFGEGFYSADAFG
ncbi:MAG TPA: hypothetical protein PLU30_27555, partial [Verrucomicrobiae bacterium]|nr:hypothetical protein [Verrucomicrobiae bacterium]